MSERLLLKYMCAVADKRISESTQYAEWHGPVSSGYIHYTIPPAELASIYEDYGPVIKPEHMPQIGRAELHAFISGDYRILIAYAPELDTVYWEVST